MNKKNVLNQFNSLSPWEKVYNLIQILLFLVLFLGLVFFIFNSISALRNPFPMDYGEGIVLSYDITLEKQGILYSDINNYPFVYNDYPPLFMLIIFPFVKLFGPLLIIPRLLSIISTFLIALFIYLIFVNESKNKILALLFSMFLFIPHFIYKWGVLGRVDMLGILFSLIGLYIYLKYNKTDSKLGYFAYIFFILAFFTKQSLVAIPLSIITYNLLVERKIKEFFKNAVYFFVPLLSLFFMLNLLTKGQFYLHIISYQSFIPINFSVALYHYIYFIKKTFILIMFCLLAAILSRKIRIYSIYFVISFIFLVTIGKNGAYINYFIEPFIALLILSFFSVEYLLLKIDKKVFLSSVILALLVVPLFSLILSISAYENSFHSMFTKYNYEYDPVVKFIRENPGDVLSERIWYTLINKREVILNDPFQFSLMAEKGIWNQSKLIEDCNNKRFSVIITGERLLSIDGIAECLEKHYILSTKLNWTNYLNETWVVNKTS